MSLLAEKTFEDLVAEFIPSEKEETPDIKVQKAEPKIKSAQDMMIETAKRIGEARVKKAISNAKVKREYDVRIGKEVYNPNFFYGEGESEGKLEELE